VLAVRKLQHAASLVVTTRQAVASRTTESHVN
jgi:hypothetical protein